MSTAVLRAPGVAFMPSPSSITSAITNTLSAYARRVAFPFEFAHPVIEEDMLPSKNAPTASAIERDRFATPAELLVDALMDAAKFAFQAPGEQLVPSADTKREAIELLRMLPPDIDIPEPVIEPSGAISWSWDRGSAGFLILAVDGKGRVQRSALIDGEESWDTTPLSDSLPAEELALLARFRLANA
jgi:hypothetical protein